MTSGQLSAGRRIRAGAVALLASVCMWAAWPPSHAMARTLPDDAATLKRGAEVFAQNCASCHGLKGKGDSPMARNYNPPPPDFTRGQFRHGNTDDAIYKSIASGVPGTGMTAWKGRLSESDLSAVSAYVRSLKKSTSAHAASGE